MTMLAYGSHNVTISLVLCLLVLHGSMCYQSHALSVPASSSTCRWASSSRYANEAHVAATLLAQAVQICQSIQPSCVKYDKDDGTPVTIIDYAIQAYFTFRLEQEFPCDALWAEEDFFNLQQQHPTLDGMAWDMIQKNLPTSNHPSTFPQDCFRQSKVQHSTIPSETKDDQRPQQQRRVWILDPIDGTQGLLNNQDYAIGLALRDEHGDLVVGGMGSPSRRYPVMVAVRNEGIRFWQRDAWMRLEETHDEKHKMSIYKNWIQHQEAYTIANFPTTNNDENNPTGTTATTTIPWNHGPSKAGMEYPPYLLSRPNTMGSPLPFGPYCPPVQLCCGSLVKYFAVARGEVAGFIQYQENVKSWDHAAGILCVQEAGGHVMDGHGHPIQITGKQFAVAKGIVACASATSHHIQRHLQASLLLE